MGRGCRLSGRAGFPGFLLPAPPPRGDDAILRGGVLPEVHAVPDRKPRPAPCPRGARARYGRSCRDARLKSGSTRWPRRPSADSDRARLSRSEMRSASGPISSLPWASLRRRYDERPGARLGSLHARRKAGQRARGRAARPCGRAPRRLHPDSLSRRQARPVRGLPHVRRRSRRIAPPPSRLRHEGCRGNGGLDQLERPAVPPHADRDVAHRALEPRSWRAAERALGHGRGIPGRSSVHPPGRQTRAIRRPELAHGLRPRCLHPLQPLRPLHAGSHAVLRPLPGRPRAGRAHRADSRAFLARHGMRALRWLPRRLPDGRHLREIRGGRPSGPSAPSRR